MNRAASAKGQASAGVLLPPLPDDLRKTEPHAAVTEGQQLVSILARERQALDRANSRVERWQLFYEDIKRRFSH
ncbi:hypothetical protein ATY75_26845 [Rhizobium sp. N122]|uniref:hypothetical protein n=1 Tax=Rhizobium sp. N122 TaxID=1764272 RepID=UPI000B5A52E1|nr:hypothetical protein [Rhizobium sp. N122]OWV83021.1 hypothetical protein ATY75_26845 [Rhizobium sp. N122]